MASVIAEEADEGFMLLFCSFSACRGMKAGNRIPVGVDCSIEVFSEAAVKPKESGSRIAQDNAPWSNDLVHYDLKKPRA